MTSSVPPEVHLLAGTRPEAIKLAPVAMRMRERGRLRPVVVSTGQHPHMAAQALAAFGELPDTTMAVSRATGSQAELVAGLVTGLETHFAATNPAAVIVQGDTTTTLAGAMAAFWRRLPVVHLEAGLRSDDLDSPFPEEANRRLVTILSRLHLAPTQAAVANLRRDGVPTSDIVLTGNTVVDAAHAVAGRQVPFTDRRLAHVAERVAANGHTLVLVTAHRRESWGEPLEQVLQAVRQLLATHPRVQVVFPSHPNPAVRAQVDRVLGGVPRALVTDPLPYAELMRLLSQAYLVLTDSGGIQEEAPSFGVPVLVLREVTERMESVHAGCARLVGTDAKLIVAQASELLSNPAAHALMVAGGSPYGDGHAAIRTEQAVAALLGLDTAAQAPSRAPILWRLPTPRARV